MEEQLQPNSALEGIDLNKLRIVIRKNLIWILAIFITANLAGYLTIRWTKAVYESESELKLDIKQDAMDLGIKNIVEDQNVNVISGEIEQIKSKVFFNRVIDSLDLEISYYSIGKVLTDEKYRNSPFRVTYAGLPSSLRDIPIYFNFLTASTYRVQVGEQGQPVEGEFGQPLSLDGFTLRIEKTNHYDPSSSEDYFFVIRSRSALLDYLSDNISVEPLNFNANTIRVSFKDYNALKAYTIVQTIDSLYISYSNEQKNLANKQKIEWLNNELGQIEVKMEDYEDYFEEFTLKNKSNNVDEDLKRTIRLINRIDSQRFQLNKNLQEINKLIGDLTAQPASISIPRYQYLPAYLNQMLIDLHQLMEEREKLSLAYNENTFAFQQKEKEVSAMTNQVFTQLSELKKDWLTTLGELSKQKARLEEEFATMPDKNTQYSKKQRFYKLYEEFYLTLMQAKSEFEIAQAGNTPDFKILSPATLPTSPIGPKKLMILGIGLVASFALNFFFIGILYLTNNKITSVEEVERACSLPVLGAVPSISSSNGYMVVDNPKSMASEAIRTLRTNLDFFVSGDNKKTISISSTISGEGKSFLALNLGIVLAMSRRKVLLVDLDMRKMKDKLPFNVNDQGKGLSTILIRKHNWKETLVDTSIEYLDYIPSGPHPPNPSELLLNGNFSDFLAQVKEEYDYIVMDTPPVGLVTDGIMAMKKSDVSIYIVRVNYSKKSFLQSLSRQIKINKLQNVTLVVNALPFADKAYGYGYYEKPAKNSIRKTLHL